MSATQASVYDQGPGTMAPSQLAELIRTADLSDLRHNGDTHSLAPGYDLELVIDQDPDASLDDYDESSLGELIWRHRDSNRPSHFNGAARILDRQNYQVCWWQPPADLVKGWKGAPVDRIDSMAQWIRDRWEEGWSAVELNIIGPAPKVEGWQYVTYRTTRPTIASAYFGGVDDTSQDHLLYLLAELRADLATMVDDMRLKPPQ